MQSNRHGVQSLLHLVYSFMDIIRALRLASSCQETIQPATANSLKAVQKKDGRQFTHKHYESRNILKGCIGTDLEIFYEEWTYKTQLSITFESYFHSTYQPLIGKKLNMEIRWMEMQCHYMTVADFWTFDQLCFDCIFYLYVTTNLV